MYAFYPHVGYKYGIAWVKLFIFCRGYAESLVEDNSDFSYRSYMGMEMTIELFY